MKNTHAHSDRRTTPLAAPVRALRTALGSTLLGATLALGACGGGNITTTLSLGLPEPAASYPLSAAVSAYLQVPHEHRLSATSGTDQYTLQWHAEPGAATLFEGQLASTLDTTHAIERNGQRIAGATLTDYFQLMPFRPLGGINRSLGSYEVATHQQALPSSARIGQSGSVSDGARYADASRSTLLSTTSLGWSLESAGDRLAWACLTTEIVPVASTAQAGRESICYRLDTTGQVSAVMMRLSLDGRWLTFE